MEILYTAALSVGSAAVLFILTKIMGEKQISQLSLFDYITGITIGSIAAELATDLEEPLRPLTAMIVYGLLAFAISIVTSKSLPLRKILTGRPIILFDNGRIYRSGIKKARLDLSDFLTICRTNGFFSLDQLQTAILEHNGSISFLPAEQQRPLTPADMSLSPAQTFVRINVIIDGELLSANLRLAGKDKKWLDRRLHEQGYGSVREIMLATCGQNGDDTLTVYPIIRESKTADWFE